MEQPFEDSDDDGQGNINSSLERCTQPEGYVLNADDCDDNDSTVYIGSAELDSMEVYV